ncbi:hypothetical protein PHLGIDRAFT_123298 [Phlebiopsis gigantea 11061_1 CR5-6]|uniref:Uncharacterized protein n=1 Tax=Phlebiopsis gigantea (strain 11061_1 CR5-6) TaxID=745531 RepID=A0A0C3NAI4_PHLG1|nr:hypothetical protein PHLGIDRAFT_123298 [Phlebiopsis gigantea 11061_1 CR5-6]
MAVDNRVPHSGPSAPCAQDPDPHDPRPTPHDPETTTPTRVATPKAELVLLAVSSLFYDEEIDLKVAFLLPAVTDLRAREYGVAPRSDVGGGQGEPASPGRPIMRRREGPPAIPGWRTRSTLPVDIC